VDVFTFGILQSIVTFTWKVPQGWKSHSQFTFGILQSSAFHMEGTSRLEKPLTIYVRDSTVYCAFHMEGTSRVEKPLTIHVRDSTVYCAFHMEVPQGWKSHSQNRKPVLKDHVYCTIYLCSLLNVRIHLA
jgi:hypothetical protein